jgi:hypothetical protein
MKLFRTDPEALLILLTLILLAGLLQPYFTRKRKMRGRG